MSRSFGEKSLTRRSPMKISPEEGSSSPARQRRAVVLPQPEGPTRTRNSLSAISSVSSSSATTDLKRLESLSSLTCAIDARSFDAGEARVGRESEEHTSELQSPKDLVCRLLLEKKKSK